MSAIPLPGNRFRTDLTGFQSLDLCENKRNKSKPEFVTYSLVKQNACARIIPFIPSPRRWIPPILHLTKGAQMGGDEQSGPNALVSLSGSGFCSAVWLRSPGSWVPARRRRGLRSPAASSRASIVEGTQAPAATQCPMCGLLSDCSGVRGGSWKLREGERKGCVFAECA